MYGSFVELDCLHSRFVAVEASTRNFGHAVAHPYLLAKTSLDLAAAAQFSSLVSVIIIAVVELVLASTSQVDSAAPVSTSLGSVDTTGTASGTTHSQLCRSILISAAACSTTSGVS